MSLNLLNRLKLIKPKILIGLTITFVAGGIHAKAMNEPIKPIKAYIISEPQKVALGKELYNSKVFSKEYTTSCASCHSLKNAGTDGNKTYRGLNSTGDLNTPTILNSTLNFRQFWDGRAKSINEVIDDHLKNKNIFNSSWEKVIQKVKSIPDLAEQFNNVYPDITEKNIKSALNYYIKTLVTPDAPFDKYLLGNAKAIDEDTKRGYELFKSYGCITCHQGPNIGGNLFQKLGIYADYEPNKQPNANLGRYHITKQQNDLNVYKVPSLRNIALTAPYLHDGSHQTLEQTLETMVNLQTGHKLLKPHVKYLLKFLESLTGNMPQTEDLNYNE